MLVNDTLRSHFWTYRVHRTMGFEFLWLLWVLAYWVWRQGITVYEEKSR